MDQKFQYIAVGMIVAIALSSCAPAVANAPDAPLAAPTQEAAPAADATELSVPTSPVAATPTKVVELQVIATSRGPNLEATDPATVKLDSGQLQLVEFFRFT